MVPMYSSLVKIHIKQGKKGEITLQEGLKVTGYRTNKQYFLQTFCSQINYVFKVGDSAVGNSNIMVLLLSLFPR